ncbi:MAG: allantoicase [Gemmatimonadaceae bacterium]
MTRDDRPDFVGLHDLASERFGGAVLLANDEFFAPKDALLHPREPEWREGVYTERGKWMDGWETRRRREPGHDWCLVRLGVPGRVRGLVVDTAFFTANFPAACAVEACDVPGVPDPAELAAREGAWRQLLPQSPLEGNAKNHFAVGDAERATHLRLRIFPDGGVARLRVHGDPMPDWARLARRGEVDLAAAEHGGLALACSDMHYGNPQHMLLPGRSTHMGDGWETRRNRGDRREWAIVRLGHPGRARRVELDTDHFKGNAPGACEIHACAVDGDERETFMRRSDLWRPLLANTALRPHSRFVWEDELADVGVVTHVRLAIYPDGGVARLRVFGAPEIGGRA